MSGIDQLPQEKPAQGLDFGSANLSISSVSIRRMSRCGLAALAWSARLQGHTSIMLADRAKKLEPQDVLEVPDLDAHI